VALSQQRFNGARDETGVGLYVALPENRGAEPRSHEIVAMLHIPFDISP
jgi:hypothetical protein